MGIAKWYVDKIDKVKKLDTPMFVLYVGVKSLGAFAIGIIIAPYVGKIGWWVLAAALLLSVPILLKVLRSN
jgi:hypothetical protein